MKYKDILDTFGGDTSYADRAQAALLKWDTAAFSNVAKEYKASQQDVATQPAPNPANSQWDNVWDWNYWADTADRQDEIVSNLNTAYEQNPSQFSDWNTFAQNYNYDYSWRTDKERETMWNWYNNKVWPVQPQQQPQQEQPEQEQQQMDYNNANNTDYFFNQLLNWNPLQWEWAAITAAQNRYNNLKYLSSMTPDQISSAIESWNLNPVWQDMQDLKNYAPALYAQVQAQIQQKTQLDDINTLWDWIYNWLTKTETNWNYTNYDMSPTEYAKNASIIKQYNESLYKKIEWLGWDTAAYVAIVASMLQNPVIQASKNEVEDLEWEIRKIQENIYTVWDTARSRLWSEAPEDLVSAYISQQTKDLQNQLRTAQNSLLVAQWKLNNQLTEVETMVDAINNWIKIYWEWWEWWNWDYQFVSGSKYQKAWYFNKKTWEFIPLGSTWTSWWWTSWGAWWWTWYVDTNNYQDDSQARLQQIANNLEKLHNSNPELFNNRGTFNDYFKYNQRSAKQKQVLDSYWVKYGNKFSIWWTWTWTGTSEDGLVNAIKKDLISRTVNFTSSTMKATYWKKYQQAKSWDEDTTNDYLQEIWKISSLSEMKTMLSHLSKDANKKALLSSLKPKVISELQAIKNKTDRSNKFKEYANKLWLDAVTLANLRGIKTN